MNSVALLLPKNMLFKSGPLAVPQQQYVFELVFLNRDYVISRQNSLVRK